MRITLDVAKTRYDVGDLGIIVINMLLEVIRFELVPWPDIVSNHPWSIDFKRWWDARRGDLSVNWDESGARYHIVQDAQWLYGFVINSQDRVEGLVVRSHLKIKPRVTRANGAIFIYSGRK